MTTAGVREIYMLLRRLSVRGSTIRRAGDAYRLFAGAATGQGAHIDRELVRELLSRGLAVTNGDAIGISAAGRSALRRRLAAGASEDFGLQHQSPVSVSIEEGGARHSVSVNAAESPLAWLRHRMGPNGKPMIDAAQFEAGERLRADFTRGQLMPRITSNWSAAVADGRRDGDSGIADLTDAALAARLRAEKAIAAVGPELGGILLDFCCFLKGIEEIERARRWPARSAKLVLQLALSSLARHYGYAASTTASNRTGRLRHWGTDDYRPRIS